MAKSRNSNSPAGGTNRSITSDLQKRIAAAQRDYATQTETPGERSRSDMTGLARALRLGSEFIAAILVGAGVGFGLDLLLGTGPWLMLVMLLVGFGAGILNVVRATADMNSRNPAPLDADLGPGDEDEEDI